MKIAVDAMGGDHAPEAVVEGALLAESHPHIDLLLVGDEPRISKALNRFGKTSSIQVVHASQTISMEEAGPPAVRRKREASLIVAMRLLAEGDADAVISAGNSSAIVAGAKLLPGVVPGLKRPALAVTLPTQTGRLTLLDAGAHSESHAIHLAQSAALAHSYLKVTDGLNPPRIGLLNIGQEPVKGMKVIQRAYSLLERSSLHFIGNVEPCDLFVGRTDAVVCDGFVGNVLLKMYEGVSETLLQFLESQTSADGAEAIPSMRNILNRFHKTFHFEFTGGAPLLGIRKTVVVAHGRSKARAIANAIRLAANMADKKVFDRMTDELEKDGILTDFKHQNALLMLENLKSRWRFAKK